MILTSSFHQQQKTLEGQNSWAKIWHEAESGMSHDPAAAAEAEDLYWLRSREQMGSPDQLNY